jgi:hypothetical protein
MVTQAIQRFSFLMDTIPALLHQISKVDFAAKPALNTWSKKEVVGHLIDSATNNHQRFVRAQFEEKPSIQYNQNGWNTYSYYNDRDGEQIINFWYAYNMQLIEIIKRIPEDKLDNEVSVGDNVYTLIFLIEDYVAHMEHHLKKVIKY